MKTNPLAPEVVLTCPSCGYSEHDARFNGDHRLCKNAGKAPWDKPAPAAKEDGNRNHFWKGDEKMPCGCPASTEYPYYNSETKHVHCIKCGRAYDFNYGEKEDGIPEEPLRLLADVMHLWVDGYIAKNPNSQASDSISGDKFEAVEKLLSSHGISVDYCGWEYAPHASGDSLQEPEGELPPLDVTDQDREGNEYLHPSRQHLDELSCRERQLREARAELRKLRSQESK